MNFRSLFSYFTISFILSSLNSSAQSFVSLSTGISKDINNSNKSFYHIPICFQWKPSKKIVSPTFLKIDYDIPFVTKSNGVAYTLNPSLQQEVTLQENICSYIFNAEIGFRLISFSVKKENKIYINLLTGISFQHFIIDYKNYDKENYEILNPDVNLSSGGIIISLSGEYDFRKGNRDMFLMIHLQSPVMHNTGDYPLSYKFVAPLQLTFGYKLFYNKKKVK